MNKKPIIGIDLGTTCSAIAVLDETGTSTIIPVDGERIMASCLSALSSEKGKLFVGNVALQDLSTEPGNVLRHFKRDMGEDKTYQLTSGTRLTPEDASSRVLKKLIQEAEKTLGKIDEVVITVPANFAERQRKATIAAGEKAGVKVKHIINEPTAAALTLASTQDVNGTVLIYDLGGGTFDVTIANVRGQKVECLTSEGDFHLGGVDFDRALANIVDEAHQKEYGQTLRSVLGLADTEAEKKSPEWQELLQECEDLKKSLSKRASSPLNYRSSPSGGLKISITRDEFEASIKNLLAKTEMLMETALDNVNMSPSKIDVILLVGGSSRIPAVKDSLRKMFGKEPQESVNPDEAVAVGAAIYSGLKTDSSDRTVSQNLAMRKVSIQDVANHFYGMISVGENMVTGGIEMQVSTIIPRDTPLPCSKSEMFHTLHDGQTELEVQITQSTTEESDPKFVNVIASETVRGFPAGRPAEQPIEVTYSYDLDQTMHVKIRDVNTGKNYHLSSLLAGGGGSTPPPNPTGSLELDDLIIE